MTGRVVTFDDARGLGVIEGENGARHDFHCTAIADGTRTIDEGAAVTFEVTAGHLGRWEATAISRT